MRLYPLVFDPILKARMWGGEKLKTVLHKSSNLNKIGESWELSELEGDVSILLNGPLRGHSIKDLLSEFKADLVGKENFRRFGEKFPVLVKFIDAKQDLSVQLHPNNALAAKRHNSLGKTEMWYVMQADDQANLIIGFKEKINSETYLHHLNHKSLPEILNFEPVRAGDAFFIDAGRVHAIGAGVMLAEIQQTSDITYRIYDWDRVDAQGNSRVLHADLALDAIDFEMPDNFNVAYDQSPDRSNPMVACPYFKTNFLRLQNPLQKENRTGSFLIYVCVEGSAAFVANGVEVPVKMGQTVLMPAALKTFEIKSTSSKLLEVYV